MKRFLTPNTTTRWWETLFFTVYLCQSSPRSISLYVLGYNELTFTYNILINIFQWLISDVIMSAMASEITGVSVVYSTVCSGADHRKYQSPASLAFVRGIHRWLVDSLHKGPVTRKMVPFYDVIMSGVVLTESMKPEISVQHEWLEKWRAS